MTTVFEAQDRLHVVYPKGHPIARLKTVTPVALAEFPLILMQRDTSVRAIVDAGFHSAGLMPKATCEAIYMMTAVGMVRAGLGLTILPGSAREIKAEPGLLSKPIDDPSFNRPVSIIKRSGRTLPPLSQAFLVGFHSAGLMPKATCEAIYMMTAVGMVRAGLGLTILPGSAREIEAELGFDRKVGELFNRPVSIIKRSGRTFCR